MKNQRKNTCNLHQRQNSHKELLKLEDIKDQYYEHVIRPDILEGEKKRP